jgi:hypothetical protein
LDLNTTFSWYQPDDEIEFERSFFLSQGAGYPFPDTWRVLCRASIFRTRCKVLTWQVLAQVLPERLQKFLELKYGILSPEAMISPVSLEE